MSDAPDLAVHALSPHLVVAGAAAAIEFYTRAFGASGGMRIPGPDGLLVHACIFVNGSSVLLVDENVEWGLKGPAVLGGSPVTLHLAVDDADAWFDRAVAAGATPAMPLEDAFWGDRYGVVTDPFGHNWSIGSPLGNGPQTEDELQAAARDAMS